MVAKMSRIAVLFGGALLATTLGWTLLAGVKEGPGATPGGNWPQWRGPDRNSVSKETGLLKIWPEGGPPLVWKVTGLGSGVASVAVVGGRVFTLGKIDNDEHLTALDEVTGNKLWAVRIGPGMTGGVDTLMRWLSPRTPTVDGDRVFAVTARALLACVSTKDGTILWTKKYAEDFGGRTGAFGCGDRPLVDGDHLICTPGGAASSVVALDKKTGTVIWRCPLPGAPAAAYSATTVAEVGGIRHYVATLARGPVGIAAKDGRHLWGFEKLADPMSNYTPLVRGEHVFFATPRGKVMTQGQAMVKLIAEKDVVRVEEVWHKGLKLPSWHDGAILVGDHLYLGTGPDIYCVEWLTGNEVWKDPGAVGGAVSIATAEGLLYLLSQKSEAALIEATPKGYTLKGKLQLPDATAKPGATAPVIAAGRLYLRDDDRLFCYDIREGAAAKPGKALGQPEPKKLGASSAKALQPLKAPDEPDVVFVPTPQDVVDRMVEVAGIKPRERVCDLGCGDGRILVTAAQKHGCVAVGYDIDSECVRLARENAQQNGVGGLVKIEKCDLFTVDLHEADVVMLYLSPELNERLLPQLAKLKPGSRIVSHAFVIPGVPPDRIVTVSSTEDYIDHNVYVWTTPLKPVQAAK